MRANWIKGRKKLFANALCFLSRTARRTWKQHWLSEYIAGRSAVGVGHSGATARPASRKEMKRLIKDAKQKVFLIVDNLRVHHAKAVQDWLARHKVEIEIFYLPAYAPEHNPDEYLNNDLKQTIKNKPRAKTRDDLGAATSSIQKRPDRVKSYFHAKHVRYAA